MRAAGAAFVMKQSIREKLERLRLRLEEIDRLLAAPDAARDLDRFRNLGREHAEIAPVVGLYEALERAQAEQGAVRAMPADPEMRELAQGEMDRLREETEAIEGSIERALLPADPNDERGIFLEIRAGTGGEESALFAADLFRMYARYAERMRWQVEVVSHSASDLGGYREIIARIEGRGAYSKLKFESGVHRVQRVPATETQGRIHTSACTVAVLPEADEIGEVEIDPAAIRIDTFRSSGAGGQHINKTDSAVRITHLPTGIVVECQDDRSQHRNKAQALAVLAARIKDRCMRELADKTAATRKSLVGSGDRSERIRTYNFAQGRVTDHRINLTLYKLGAILDGELDELVRALTAEHQAGQLAALSESGT